VSAVVTGWTEVRARLALRALRRRRHGREDGHAEGGGRRGRAVAVVALGSQRPATTSTVWRIGTCFAEAGAFVFGSGLAIVPFLHGRS
jgi:chromate transporter